MRASLRGTWFQGCQKTLMDVIEATVGHDQDHIRGLRVTAEMVHNLFSGRVKPGANPLRLQRLDQCPG
jgi:hypothetical protein